MDGTDTQPRRVPLHGNLVVEPYEVVADGADARDVEPVGKGVKLSAVSSHRMRRGRGPSFACPRRS